MFVNNQHGIQRREQYFDKKFVFEGVHSRKDDSRISWDGQSLVLISCWKMLLNTGTVDRRPGSGRTRSARIEENVETDGLVSNQEDKPQIADPQDCPWDIMGDG